MSESVRSKRIYILPNLLTTGGMFFGFYAIVMGLSGKFEMGALGIVIAGIFDALDGRVARAMNAVSAFGKEYDSLADFLSFGMAPAILVHQWALAPFGRLGWAAAFFFVACSALRLARFNVQTSAPDPRISNRYFQGMPTPAAAGIVSALILFANDTDLFAVGKVEAHGFEAWFTLLLVFALGALMVSNLRFRSMKDFTGHRRKPFLTLVAAAGLITVLTIHLTTTLLAIGLFYIVSVLHSHREYQRLLAEGKEVERDEAEEFSL
ncbi:CDP-diacylglycerol--serine O-phosphatidyltransferase [Magnetofaba australis]|uniref:CDP-diacylglycerol--serine O-phosphatidyltransferase n=1 Tax=Magnetofaba australis IT-1 TaxID=1434232 RepID=A0A1Y2K765_9PROT|nr:CDP-diacylglycerol--serine O-phosphatidyltransferase [Magnetofaba australis]OSM04291.1 putative CDP-diacylglycerol--serine O-phosphatidyltransferase [Magnetofaba australis IT-1]